MFPGLSTIKYWVIGILTLGVSILFGLWKGQQAARAKDELNRMKLGKKAKEQADKALIDGLQREQESKNEKINDSDIDRFY